MRFSSRRSVKITENSGGIPKVWHYLPRLLLGEANTHSITTLNITKKIITTISLWDPSACKSVKLTTATCKDLPIYSWQFCIFFPPTRSAVKLTQHPTPRRTAPVTLNNNITEMRTCHLAGQSTSSSCHWFTTRSSSFVGAKPTVDINGWSEDSCTRPCNSRVTQTPCAL